MIGDRAAADNVSVIRATSNSEEISVDNGEWLQGARFEKDGADLIIEGKDGQTLIIEGYFTVEAPPTLVAPDGQIFPYSLIQAFFLPEHPGQYAGPSQGAEPVGTAREVSGEVTVTRTDGTVEKVEIGTVVFQGDVIETEDQGAVELIFVDETSFAISEDARMAIDEYIYDPSTQSGSTDVSMLRGLFIFSSGLIARNDPDDVNIETPVGSIGIRGTIIAGDVGAGRFTVLEGAIVVRSTSGQEMTLSQAMESVSFNFANGQIEAAGIAKASEIGARFASLSKVAPSFFAAISRAEAADGRDDEATETETSEGEEQIAQEAQEDAVTEENVEQEQSEEGAQELETDPEPESEAEADSEADTETDPAVEEPVTEDDASTETEAADSTENQTESEATTDSDSETITEASEPAVPPATTDTSDANGYDSGDSLTEASTTDTSTNDTSTTESNFTYDNTSDTSSDSDTTTSDDTQTEDSTQLPPPNNAPTIGNADFSLNENSAIGTEIGAVSASDPDSGQVLTYSIESGNDAGIFTINSETGVISVAGEINYETADTHSLTVKVTDNGTGSLYDTATVNIDVNDVNDAPVIDDLSFTLQEDAVALMKNIPASDEDAGQNLTYAITGGNTGGAFSINAATGELNLAAALDRETVSEYNLAISVTDDGTGTLQDSAIITVSIGDVNDSAPAMVAAGPFAVNENSAYGTVVGTVTATDADITGSLSYSVIGGTGAGVFGVDSSTGEITVLGGLNYEAQSAYTLNIEVSDGVGTDSLMYTIDLNDLDEFISLNTADPGSFFRIDGNGNKQFGDDIAIAGDIDGDGYSEVLLVNGSDDTVYRIDGTDRDLISSNISDFNVDNGAIFLDSYIANFDYLAGADTTPPNELTVSYIGDFDGDGDADFIVGAYSADSPSTNDSGQIFIIDAAGNTVLELTGFDTDDWVGESVAGVGDVNNDGYDDVLIGAPLVDSEVNPTFDDGAAYILYGRPVSVMPETFDIGHIDTGMRGVAAGVNLADAVVDGNYMYALDSTGTINRYDISDPLNPSWLSNASDANLADANSICFDNASQRAVATSGTGDYVLIYQYPAGPNYNFTVTSPIDCIVENNRAFILTSNNDIHIIESLSGSPPNLNGTSISLDTIDAGWTNVLKIDTDGESVYVLTDDEIIKINPAVNPASIGGDVSFNVAVPAGSTDIAIDASSNTAYVSNNANDEISIIDLDTGSLITNITSGDYSDLANVKGLYVKQDGADHYLYASSSNGTTGSVLMFDITDDPENPIFMGSFSDSMDGFMDVGFDVVAPEGSFIAPFLMSGSGQFQVADPLVEGVTVWGTDDSNLGTDVASAGDFNDDGYMDFVVSYPDAGNNQAWLFFGDGNFIGTMSGIDNITIDNIFADGRDMPLHSIGDINDDGISDIAVESPGANGGKGNVHIIFGSPAYTNQTVDASALDGTNGFTITTGAEVAHILSAGMAGDFNADGIDDMVVAVKDPGSRDISMYVLFGGNDSVFSDGTVDLTELGNDANAFHMIYTIPASVADPDGFDINITSAGDMDGDGFEDIAIAMPENDNTGGGEQDGSAFIVYGRDTDTSPIVMDNEIQQGPVAAGQWQFDEDAGATANDSIAGHDGTLNNFVAVQWDTNDGAARGSLEFDGANDYVRVASGPDISGSDFTISTWVNLAASGVDQTVLSHGVAGANTELVMGFDASDHLFVSFGGSTLTCPGTFSSGNWYNIAVGYDAASNVRTLFVNGIAVVSDSPDEDFLGAGVIDIGVDSFTSSDYFNGKIDDLRIYDQRLTNEQIEDIASREMDMDATTNDMQASANYQSLVGNEENNIMDDNGMLGITMRGGGGDDQLIISNGSFQTIDGGPNSSAAGRDILSYNTFGGTLDFSGISGEQISHIEEISTISSNQTIKLTFGSLFNLMKTSDIGDLYINGNDASNHLTFDSEGASVADANATQTEFAKVLQANYGGASGGYETFEFGGSNLKIATSLFDNGQVEVL